MSHPMRSALRFLRSPRAFSNWHEHLMHNLTLLQCRSPSLVPLVVTLTDDLVRMCHTIDPLAPKKRMARIAGRRRIH
jgi:hypothetical protein